MSERFKKRIHHINSVEVTHDKLTSGNWDYVVITRNDGGSDDTHTPDKIIWDRIDNKVYIRADNGDILWWASMDRCTFYKQHEWDDWVEVPELP